MTVQSILYFWLWSIGSNSIHLSIFLFFSQFNERKKYGSIECLFRYHLNSKNIAFVILLNVFVRSINAKSSAMLHCCLKFSEAHEIYK